MLKVMCVSAALIATAATAQAPSDVPDRNAPNNDPNQVICRNEPVIGSRVNRVRVCKTRAEWADSRSLDRRGIERAQNQRSTSGQ
jgi:hypothetical protein